MTRRDEDKLSNTIVRIGDVATSLKGVLSLLEGCPGSKEMAMAQLSIITRDLDNLYNELDEYDIQEGITEEPDGPTDLPDIPPMMF